MKTYLVIPDLHVPFHCRKYLKLLSKILKIHRFSGLVQLGDAIDAFQISSYSKDPSRRNTLAEDINDYKLILNEWSSLLPRNASVHLICGNHENRLSKYIANQARDLHGLVPDWKTLLGVDLRNKVGAHKWYYHPYEKWDSCKIGDCVLMHGFYYNQHTAMTMLAKYKCNTVAGHTHRVQYVTDGVHYAVTLGHGSNEIETSHSPVPTGWSQAFGLLHVDNSGRSRFDICHVQNGRTVIYGQAVCV